LVADRGWWAAQDPWRKKNIDRFKPLSDATTLEGWALKFTLVGEVDIWAYRLPGNTTKYNKQQK